MLIFIIIFILFLVSCTTDKSTIQDQGISAEELVVADDQNSELILEREGTQEKKVISEISQEGVQEIRKQRDAFELPTKQVVKEVQEVPYYRQCNVDTECLRVPTIRGLEYIPENKEDCGCTCETVINKKYQDLWSDARLRSTNLGCEIRCSPCAPIPSYVLPICAQNTCSIPPYSEW